MRVESGAMAGQTPVASKRCRDAADSAKARASAGTEAGAARSMTAILNSGPNASLSAQASANPAKLAPEIATS